MNNISFNISFSGGLGSAVSALVAHHHGLPFRLIFADTLMEDSDLYRFVSDVARTVGQEVVRLEGGRTPWDVVVRKWLDANSPRYEPLVLGMDWSEQDRIERAQRVWAPRPVVSLLSIFKVTRPTYAKWLADYGLKEPELYGMGFPAATRRENAIARQRRADIRMELEILRVITPEDKRRAALDRAMTRGR
jgi:hypothetical protein